MAMMPLVPEIKMADVRKLISLRNLLVWKVTWLVLSTTSATLILSHVFGADYMTGIAYIYFCLPSTHSLIFRLTESTHSFHCDFRRQHSYSLHCDLQRQHILSIVTSGDSTLTLSIATYRDNTFFPL